MYDQDEFAFARQYLGNNEYILWRGKPEKGNLFTKRELLNSLMGVGVLIFMIFWISGAASAGGFFALFGVPMVLFALYQIFGRYIVMATTRKQLRYVVTNRKIIRARGNKIDFLNCNNLPSYHTEVYPNGCGSVFFQIRNLSDAPVQNNTRSLAGSSGFAILNVSDLMALQAALDRMEK